MQLVTDETEPSIHHRFGPELAPPLDSLGRAIARVNVVAAQAEYFRQGEFLVIPDFLSRDAVADLRDAAFGLGDKIVRHGIPGIRAAGASSLFDLEAHAPILVDLYRDPRLIGLVSQITDHAYGVAPPSDPHGCAIYDYTREGDRIGWHYDTSFYRGARLTALLGLHDDSSARLVHRLHTRSRNRPTVECEVATRPGCLVIFDGDSVLHRVSPIRAGERRTVLSLQYVTSTEMSFAARCISNFKDAVQYFGFRGFFSWFSRRSRPPTPRALPASRPPVS